MEINVEFISRELIKPSSATPDDLRHLQLSFLDQIQVPAWMPFVLFYSNKPNTSNYERSSQLKKSLSKTLTSFYPFAGRVRGNSCVECNDEGVLFVEAQANCPLSDVVRTANPGNNNKFIPLPVDDGKDFAAFFQVTFFTCGGMAISLAMSHKLGDALSKLIFLNCWAAITRGDNDSDLISSPSFGSASLFPPRNMPGLDPRSWIRKDKIVAKRYVFDASIISSLRSKYNAKYGTTVSRVEALGAFIWSRFMASSQANQTDNKLYLLLHAVNLRPRMEPPLSNLHVGNITRIATAMADMDAKDDECYGIVKRMNHAIRSVNADFVKNLQKSDDHLNFLKENSQKSAKEEMISFSISSLCKFPIYEIDFGWGKPVWVGSARLVFKNLVIFFDTKEGNGIEAWINLKEEDMGKFENDKELLAHVSAAPNKIDPVESGQLSRL